MSVEEQPQQTNQPSPTAPSKTRNHTLIWITLTLAVIAIAWALFYFLYLQYHEYTDDAYSNGNMINITTVISGTPIAILADNTDLVEEGQPLVLLDPTTYQIAYDRELTYLAVVARQVRQLYDAVASNTANVEAKRALLAQAEFDFQNRHALIDSGAVSGQDYVHARDSLLVAAMALKQAEADLASALHSAGPTVMEHHPLIEQQKTSVRQAYYNLSHCTVRAPHTGYVAQRKCQVGQWVTPSTNMMAVIPTDYMWVDANYRETQLKYMRIGQPATVTFDLYGKDVVFEGKVLGIPSGSGSVFSLIPPQNATGNWIKIVQRLPVRISVDPEKRRQYPLRLGLSAEVDVTITEQDLPMLAQTPPSKPIAVTDIFVIPMEGLELVMDEIVTTNLQVVGNGF